MEQALEKPDRDDALRQRLTDASERLQAHLFGGHQFAKDTREAVRSAIVQRRKAAQHLTAGEAGQGAAALAELEKKLSEIEQHKPVTEGTATAHSARFEAWFHGDQPGTVPPPLPKPETKKPAKLIASKRSDEKKTATAPDTPETKTEPAEASFARAMLRRAAILLVLFLAIAGLRDSDRRSDLAFLLALDYWPTVRSAEDVIHWFQLADWTLASRNLMIFACDDLRLVRNGIVLGAGEVMGVFQGHLEVVEAALVEALSSENAIPEARPEIGQVPEERGATDPAATAVEGAVAEAAVAPEQAVSRAATAVQEATNPKPETRASVDIARAPPENLPAPVLG